MTGLPRVPGPVSIFINFIGPLPPNLPERGPSGGGGGGVAFDGFLSHPRAGRDPVAIGVIGALFGQDVKPYAGVSSARETGFF